MLLPGEIQIKNRFLIFVFMKDKIANRPKIPVTEGEGKTGSDVTAKKMAVVLGTRLGVFRVFVELSLEEMLRQQQSKACLHHGRDVFKEMS